MGSTLRPPAGHRKALRIPALLRRPARFGRARVSPAMRARLPAAPCGWCQSPLASALAHSPVLDFVPVVGGSVLQPVVHLPPGMVHSYAVRPVCKSLHRAGCGQGGAWGRRKEGMQRCGVHWLVATLTSTMVIETDRKQWSQAHTYMHSPPILAHACAPTHVPPEDAHQHIHQTPSPPGIHTRPHTQKNTHRTA